MSSGWLRFVALRLGATVPVLLALLLVSVVLQNITPGDPARAIAGERATPEQLDEVRRELGLDRSIPAQYALALGHLLHGNLGTSSRSGVPVSTLIAERVGVTMWLLVAGLIVTVLLGIPAAYVMATSPRGLVARALDRGLIVALNCPPFWVALVLASVVALRTGWFPVGGFGETFPEHLHSIALPALTIALPASAFVARSATASIREVLEANHVTTARSLGLRGRPLLVRHVLRNALPPVVTMLSFQVAALVLGAVVVEQTFGLSGLGSAMIQAASARDFPVVQALTLVFGAAIVLVFMVADFAVAALDPRIRR